MDRENRTFRPSDAQDLLNREAQALERVAAAISLEPTRKSLLDRAAALRLQARSGSSDSR